MHHRRRLVALAAVLFVLSGLSPGSAAAQDAPAPARPEEAVPADAIAAPGPLAPPLERADLEPFLDGFVGAQLDDGPLPGATVAVVRDGRVVLGKGYGHADVEAGVTVDPARSLFRAGSVSKLVTWTAVMRLVEEGRLDLDRDVNAYLGDFRLPETFPEPVTLTHLLTHTPGFEDRILGVFRRSPDDLQPLGEYLAAHVPARIRPPGRITAYSNYGAALAGHVVAQVAGVSFDEYVEAEIFRPLGMRRSTFRQPLPDALAPDAAVGYRRVEGRFEAAPFEVVQEAPAGALSAPAEDIARFMIAHLGGGEDAPALLQPETLDRMHRRHFTNDPRVSGMALGFLEQQVNGRRLLVHGGDTELFHSLLVLVPDARVGLYVSYNADQGGAAPQALLKAFMDRYFPATGPGAPVLPEAEAGPAVALAGAGAPDPGALQRFAGDYVMTRHNHTSSEKLLALFMRAKVTPTADGRLRMDMGALGREPSYWTPVAPLAFRRVDRDEELVFRESPDGRVSHAFLSNLPMIGAVRARWWESSGLHFLILGAAALLSGTVLLAPGLGALSRPRRVGLQRPPDGGSVAARWAAALAGLGVLALLVRLATHLSGTEVLYEPPLPGAWRLLAWATAGLAALVLLLAVQAYRRRWWGPWGRLHYGAFAAAAAAFAWFLLHWNLLAP